jgi:hypothetical protein
MSFQFLKGVLLALPMLLILANTGTASPLIDPTSFFKRQECPVHGGVATFFCSGTSPTDTTACNMPYDSSAPGVAISTLLIPNAEDCKPYVLQI